MIVVAICSLIAFSIGWLTRGRLCRKRHAATWYVQPSPDPVVPRTPPPGEVWPTVASAFYGRTNLPSSNSTMD